MTERTGASPWRHTSSMTAASSSCRGGGGVFFLVLRARIRRIVGDVGSERKLGRAPNAQDAGQPGGALRRPQKLEGHLPGRPDTSESLHAEPTPTGVRLEHAR